MAVRVSRDANKMLLDAIIRGATKQSQLGTGYGRTGAMTALTANYDARQPVSLFSNDSCRRDKAARQEPGGTPVDGKSVESGKSVSGPLYSRSRRIIIKQ